MLASKKIYDLWRFIYGSYAESEMIHSDGAGW